MGMPEAVVLLGHGSRVSEANEPLLQAAAMVSARLGGIRTVPAYLQLAPPSLAEALVSLYASGVRRVAVVPFFLYPGAHVREDIPAEVEKLRQTLQGFEITITDHLGIHPLMADVVADRVRCAMDETGRR